MGKMSVTLVCYLDDSADQATISALGGYITRTEDWAKYEVAAADVYSEFDVSVLHTKDLHSSRGEFAEWSGERKLNFVEALFDAAKDCGAIGVAACVRNSLGKKFNQSSKSTARISTLGLLFAQVVMALRRDGGVYHLPHPCPDVSMILETGNKNNNGILRHYDEVREKGSGFDFVKSLSFVGKRDCYAIQLADFWAFHSRRLGSRTLNGHAPLEVLEAMPIQEGCERLHALAAYRCPHHLKIVTTVERCKETGGVRTLADSYSMDPNDIMYLPSE